MAFDSFAMRTAKQNDYPKQMARVSRAILRFITILAATSISMTTVFLPGSTQQEVRPKTSTPIEPQRRSKESFLHGPEPTFRFRTY
jgi:hypothetical protein